MRAARIVPVPWLIAAACTAVAALAGFVAAVPGTTLALTVADFAILLAVLVAVASCSRAARRPDANARGWRFMTIAASLWAAGQGVWTFFGITQHNVYPFPSLADAAFLGYALPAAIALFSFPRPQGSGVALMRTLLDAAVIASAVLFISWATVLGPVSQTKGQDFLAHLTGVAYPVVDVLMGSLVLVLTMRSAPGDRLRWLCLGGGLLVLALTDSVYVRLTFEGVTGVTGTPLAAGWVCAFLLLALAPLARHTERSRTDRRVYTLALELLPYVPVAGAILVSPDRLRQEHDPFLLLTGLTVVVLVVARQFVIIYQNVTLTRDLESKVAERTAQLEGLGAIVNSSDDAILGSDSEGLITIWNPGAQRLYGYAASEMIGRNRGFLMRDHDRESELATIKGVFDSGDACSYETERVRKDGSVLPVSMTVSPIRGEHGVRGIATIAQDITARRAAEAELLVAREAAEESSRLKSEFLATMSHEIRTPMNGVIGLTSLLLETDMDETQRLYADGVKGAGEALLTLINDILDFSKLEAGKVDLDPAPFDPRVLVEEVAVLLAESAQAKRLELIAYCHHDVPPRLVGDAGRIRQILLNLASNAVKFTASGEVAVRVHVVEADAGRVTVRFEVRDTGIGIDAADHDRLFESFSQADASTTRRFGGTGLGLAISRRLTEAMDGEIGVSSALDKGSTFWFAIPLPVAPAAPAAAILPPDLLTGLRVLVVDDNATNRLVLESQLTDWGMKPDAVTGGQEALVRSRAEEAAGRPYDIAVLDMCMPQMDGLELARILSGEGAAVSARMMMLTSTMHVDRAELAAAGVREWLTKPVRSSALFDRLMRLVAAPSAAVVGPVARTLPAQHGGPSRGRILVVEDNEVNQLVARGMVAKLGYQVDLVEDGSQAVAATEKVRYAAVLMDCHMPVMDGFEATGAIRAREGNGRRLPIIAMTAGALDEDRERCSTAGMDDYLSKPVDLAKLEAVLARWIPPVAPPGEEPILDPARLSILRSLGASDGQGLLPQAAEAFRQDIQPSLDSLRRALDDGRGEALEEAAHKLKGAAASIGANRAAALCHQLERTAGTPDHAHPDLLARLEAELALVEAALGYEVAGKP
ncbi:response regulator [Pseudarthrobacter sp. O4]|uniref:hybrid sensor histidine kinase/response regulator n=1 Tax=Pseudarthrobacter sp. O4 TaxID=3418417 RepID=UPI003CF0AD7A